MLRVRVRVDWRASFDLTGRVLWYLAVPLAFALSLAVWYGESVVPFLAAILLTLAVGGALRRLPGDPGTLGPREAFLAVAAIWFLVAAVGAVPFAVSGAGVFSHRVNAMSESMSGLATTLRSFSARGRAIVMW